MGGGEKDREKQRGEKWLSAGGVAHVTAGIATILCFTKRNNNATPSRLACRVSAYLNVDIYR